MHFIFFVWRLWWIIELNIYIAWEKNARAETRGEMKIARQENLSLGVCECIYVYSCLKGRIFFTVHVAFIVSNNGQILCLKRVMRQMRCCQFAVFFNKAVHYYIGSIISKNKTAGMYNNFKWIYVYAKIFSDYYLYKHAGHVMFMTIFKLHKYFFLIIWRLLVRRNKHAPFQRTRHRRHWIKYYIVMIIINPTL